MKPEEDEVCTGWIAEVAPFEQNGGYNGEAKDGHRDDAIGVVGGSIQPAVVSGTADEPADQCRNYNSRQSGKEQLNPIVVVAIVIVGGGQCQKFTVGRSEEHTSE